MTRKSDLATELGGGYEFFRKQLRELEKSDTTFFVGRNKYLTEIEANKVRAHYKSLKTVSK